MEGRVVNIRPYGAFVDLGEHGVGLVHISEISDAFVNDVATVLAVDDTVVVRVLSVDNQNNRIALSMRQVETNNMESEYERVVRLGGDWGHPWNDDGQANWLCMGPRPKGPYAWQVDQNIFRNFQQLAIHNRSKQIEEHN